MANQFSTNATTVTSFLSRNVTRVSIVEQMRQWQARVRQLLSVWQRRSSDRAALRSLSQQAIHDFCPRLTEAETEMNKPFWRA
jgi:uncharacterized protein YjiS (DUF1127 family)